MAYEAMNNAEAAGNRLVVILNDNDMSIAPRSAGLSGYLARLVSSAEFLGLREIARRIARKLPEPLHRAARKTDEVRARLVMGGTLFEELGLLLRRPDRRPRPRQLIPVLENVRDAPRARAWSTS
jgi:1-deoxy-D-xylulose-5-phosphate synthase